MAWVGRFDDFADVDTSDFGPPRFKKNSIGRSNFQRRQSHDVQSNFVSESFSTSPVAQDYGRIQIVNISSHLQSVSIAGVVIAREGPRIIISKRGSGNERHLICLTVRDGPMSFINVTCWGGQEYVNFLHSQTAIGEVIEIKGAQVQEKSNPADDKFKPWTPCSCQLNVSETNGCVSPYTGNGLEVYASFLHMPTRATNDYCTLEDINTSGINLQGELVNILAIVKKIWPAKDITTKTGKRTTKQDVVLGDETCQAFSLTLWDSLTELAERWQPMETVIFACDVKIMYNDFRSTMAASTGSKTIFTTDPDTQEAHILMNFAKAHQGSFYANASSDSQFAEDNRDPDLNTITNVLTIQEAKALQTEVASHDGRTVYGVLHAFLSHFDVDGDEKSIIRHVCPKCHKTVLENTGYVCSNPGCSGGDSPFEEHLEYSFPVNFSDHTGTLEFCHLQNHVAELLLGCKAQEFSQYAIPQKTDVKWVYLLEKTRAVIKIKKRSNRAKAFVNVLSLEKLAN